VKIIQPKNTLKETIPLMALMVALNVIFITIASYLPFGGIILCLFLPLISSVFALNTKLKFYPIYLICSLGLGMATTFQDFSFTLLYLLPSLIQGLLFAITIKHRIDGTLAYFYSTFVLFIVNLAIIPLLNLIYSVDTINSIIVLLSLNKIDNINYFIYAFIYIYCAICMFFVYIVTKGELKRIGYNLITFTSFSLQFAFMGILFSIINFIFWYFKMFNIAFLFLVMSLLSSIILSIQLIKTKPLLFGILTGVSIIVSWLIYILILNWNNNLESFLILSSFAICISLIALIYYIYQRIVAKKQKREGN
jgi:hypothetical protein